MQHIPKQLESTMTPENMQAEYGSLSMRELARRLAEAEYGQDTQVAATIGDVLLDKMIATEMDFSETGTEANQQSDKLWQSVMKSYDKQVQKLGRVPHVTPTGLTGVPQESSTKDKLQTLAVDLKQVHDKWEEVSRFSIESVAISRPRIEGGVNGDTVLKDEDLRLFGVFDGVGGDKSPDVASQEAMMGVKGYYLDNTTDPRSVKEAVKKAKAAMDAARVSVMNGEVGATTVTFAKIERINDRPHLVWGHAGDTRLFLQRGKGGTVKALTTDQSEGRYLYNGIFTNLDFQPTVQDEFGAVPLELDDRIMICSDGITGDKPEQKLTEAELREALDMNDLITAAHKLFRTSRKRDDKSVVIIDINEGESRNLTTQPIAGTNSTKEKQQSTHLAPGAPNEAPERHRKRRHKWTAAVLGAVAATGVALALITGGADEKSKNSSTRAQPSAPAPANIQSEAAAKAQARREARMEVRHHAQKAAETNRSDYETTRTLRLSVGGLSHTTIWGQSAQYLQEHGYLTKSEKTNEARIATVKNAVLASQNLSEQDARSLPVGYTFTIPRWALKQARTIR